MKSHPTVLFDHQVFDAQEFGGISRYYYEIIRRMPAAGFNVELDFVYTRNHYLLEDAGLGLRKRIVPAGLPSRLARKAQSFLPSWNRDLKLRSRRLTDQLYDVFHPTYYDPYFLDAIGQKPFVLTIYDMIHELFPGEFAPHDPVPVWKRKLAHKATVVLAISEQTKRDAARILNLPPERIIVTHLASSISRRDHAGGGDYVLFVGQRSGYKNFALFLEAMAPILNKRSDLRLLCAGGGPFTNQENTMIAKYRLGDQISQRPVQESQLPSLYQSALLFVFPSLYEGFGLPVLEAFSCGCPVACSSAGSLPEVAGEAAQFFDPKDQTSITGCIESILDSSELRSRLTVDGYKRAEAFSWDSTFALTKEVYQKVAQ